jgi:hypothetical protein
VAALLLTEVLADSGDVSEVQIKTCNGVRLAISQSFYCFRKRSFTCSARGLTPVFGSAAWFSDPFEVCSVAALTVVFVPDVFAGFVVDGLGPGPLFVLGHLGVCGLEEVSHGEACTPGGVTDEDYGRFPVVA